MKTQHPIMTVLSILSLSLGACTPAASTAAVPKATNVARRAVPASAVPGGAQCAAGSGSSSYTAKICITGPGEGGTLIGDATVDATVTFNGSGPAVQHVAFYLDGQPLLEDFTAPYTFVLPGKDWADGQHTLSAEALLRDQYTTPQASISVVLKNGTSGAPGPGPQFHATSGTVPAAGQPLIVAAVGDGAGGDPTEAQVVSQIASWNPNLFLYLGDVYENGGAAEFYNWYRPDTFFGRFKAITDPTVGNHEYLTRGAQPYFDFWGSVPPYYSFDAGGWHFISLNSNSSKVSIRPGSAQYQWLQNDLAGNHSKCTIVYFHHPFFSIGKEGSTPALADAWKLMAQDQVTLVLNGHDHEYQRWAPLDGAGQPSEGGVTEFVVGTGGHSLTTFVTSDKRVAFSAQKQFGALRLQLNPDSASFSYITSKGQALDSGTVSCKGQ